MTLGINKKPNAMTDNNEIVERTKSEVIASLRSDYIMLTKHGLAVLIGTAIAAMLVTLGISWHVTQNVLKSTQVRIVENEIQSLYISSAIAASNITSITSRSEQLLSGIASQHFQRIETEAIIITKDNTPVASLGSTTDGAALLLFTTNISTAFSIILNPDSIAAHAFQKEGTNITVLKTFFQYP